MGTGLHGFPSGERGSWYSSNGDVVQVNSYTGEAQAVGEGTATGRCNSRRLDRCLFGFWFFKLVN